MQYATLAILIGLMYVLMILPQQRRVKRHRELVESVGVGDEICTSSGMYGTVVGVDADEQEVIEVEISEGVVIRLSRDAVAQVAVEDEGPEADSEV